MEAYLLSGKLDGQLAAFLTSHPTGGLEKAPKDLVDKLMKYNGMPDTEDLTKQESWSAELLQGLGCFQFQA
jgi:hypothetical protein